MDATRREAAWPGKGRSMKGKLNGALLGVCLLVTACISLVFYTFEQSRYDNHVRRIQALLTTVAERNMENMANELFAGQSRALRLTLADMLRISGVDGVAVYGSDGGLYMASDPEHGLALGRLRDRLTDGPVFVEETLHGEPHMVYFGPVRALGEDVGFVRLSYSLAEVMREGRQLMYVTAALLLTVFLSLAVLLNRLLTRMVVRPVARLSNVVRAYRRLGAPDLSAAEQGGTESRSRRREKALAETVREADVLAAAHPDEIGQLARDFADMATGLEEGRRDLVEAVRLKDLSVRQLEETNVRLEHFAVELEALVQARTKELVESNEMLRREVAERRAIEDSLRQAEEKYRTIFEQAVEGVYRTSVEGGVLEANPAMARILGYGSPQELMQEVTDLGRQVYVKDVDREELIARAMAAQGVHHHTVRMRRKDGEIIWVELSMRAVKDGAGGVRYIEGIMSDVTERKVGEMDLKRKATIDELTGIPNRFLFLDRLEQTLAHARRYSSPFALLFVDLNLFKDINDTYGHREGDKVLALVARRIQERVRGSDTVARLGGDEFAVIVGNLKSNDDAARVADAIVEAIGRPFEVQGASCQVGAAVGISVFPMDGETADDLLHKADSAMYRAKRSGHGSFRFWGEAMGSEEAPQDVRKQ